MLLNTPGDPNPVNEVLEKTEDKFEEVTVTILPHFKECLVSGG